MDQISVLSMAQAVTEKRQNPPAAENSQTQSSFREMLADRRKAQIGRASCRERV